LPWIRFSSGSPISWTFHSTHHWQKGDVDDDYDDVIVNDNDNFGVDDDVMTLTISKTQVTSDEEWNR